MIDERETRADQGWDSAIVQNCRESTTLNGHQIMEGVRRAVDWLEEEEPGGAKIDAIVMVFQGCAHIVEQLVDLRNVLRQAKGLPSIEP